MPRKRCVVIGAGLAGLSAAYKLVRQGWKVKVFEAQDRPGGRVLSHRFEAPYQHLVCELGAEWIGESHERVLAHCRKFGLQRESHRYSTTFWMDRQPDNHIYGPASPTLPKGPERRYEKFLSDFRKMPFTERRQLDDYDWWTILRRNGLKNLELLRQRELEDGTDFGESIRMASGYVAAMEYAYSSDTDELDFKVRGGNDGLINAFAGEIVRLGGTIHLEAPVKAIHQDTSGVALVVQGRTRRVRADVCICAVPATCLAHFTWSPRPEEHLDAAEQLQYSRITKTAVLFENRFWPSRSVRRGGRKRPTGFAAFTNRVADFCFDSTFGVPKKKKAGVLCSYSFGEKAANISSEDPQRLAKWIRDDVNTVLDAQGFARESNGWQQKYQVKPKPWHADKWAGGAYAFYRPGQWFSIRPILQRPFGRVLFAGEHLAEESGFMESAVRSGEITAGAL